MLGLGKVFSRHLWYLPWMHTWHLNIYGVYPILQSTDVNLQSTDVNPESTDVNPESTDVNPESTYVNPESTLVNMVVIKLVNQQIRK